jgi:hypothetical protein
MFGKQSFPEAEKAAEEVLFPAGASFPLKDDLDFVIARINDSWRRFLCESLSLASVRWVITTCGVFRIGRRQLVGYSDVSAERLETLKARFAAPTYTDYRELIEKEKPEAVSITVPTSEHEKVASFALNAGVNVLVENRSPRPWKKAGA